MADKTKIEWTDATWNPITGCSVVSPGCTNCYAMKLAGTRLRDHPTRKGLTIETKAGPVWNGEVRFNESKLDEPLRWGRPRMIFVCAHGDLFAEGVPDKWIDRVFAVMALAPQHTFQVLTKRAERMRDYLRDERTPGRIARTILDMWLAGEKHARAAMAGDRWPVRSIGDIDDPDDVTIDLPLPNVWLGVSAEDQKRADERVPLLLSTPAAVRWVSAEPLLGPIDFTRIHLSTEEAEFVGMPHLTKCRFNVDALAGAQSIGWRGLDWIVAGGESGKSARPMHPDWARVIGDQCATAGVAFLFKQWGEWAPCSGNDGTWPTDEDGFCRLRADGSRSDDGWPMQRVGKAFAGRFLDGVIHDGYPNAEEVPFG